MPADNDALINFANLGNRLFWLRQVMFLGATLVTTTYLASAIPVACYLACLLPELLERQVNHRILAQRIFTADQRDAFCRQHLVIAVASAIAVSAYGIIVAVLSQPEFFFVPLSYVFAAALYATIFNHQIKQVFTARISIYVGCFVILALVGLTNPSSNIAYLGFAHFITLLSISTFFIVNAFVSRSNYAQGKLRMRQADERERLLRQEVEDRQTAEAAQARSELRFKSLFESAPIAIREEDLSGMKRLIDGLGITDREAFETYLDTNPDFTITLGRSIVALDANRASLAQHRYDSKDEMLRTVMKEIAPGTQQVMRQTALAIFDGADEGAHETVILRADGSERTVAATWSVVPGHEDTYARVLLCSVDLTDRLEAEGALRQAQKMEAVGQLTGGVAHDFNNLLTVIGGNVDLLEASHQIDPDLSNPIKRAVQRGADLTQRLLAFSRNQPLAASSIDISCLINSMSDLLRRSLGEDVVVSIDLPSDLWQAHADGAQVESAILNLALNSRDAMPMGGKLRISCRNRVVGPENDLELEPGDYVALSVSDTGTGMTDMVARRAVEPFFTTKEVGKGSGLGLSMVYGFAKQSRGGFDIERTSSAGTVVTLMLPRAWIEASPEVTPETAPVQASGQGEVILLLEDDHDVRNYLTQLLAASGYRPLPAPDARAARKLFEEADQIDLLVSDIMLPGGIRGPEFAAEIQRRDPSIPVVFISGHTPGRLAEPDRDHAGPPVLSKPFTREAILTRISEELDQSRAP